MDSKTFIGGVLVGAAAGVAIGIFLMSNEDTKEKITRGVKALVGTLKDAADAVKDLKDRYAGALSTNETSDANSRELKKTVA